MEDFLILLLQALGEIIFQLFAYWPWDLFWYREGHGPADRGSPTFIATVVSVAFGILLGWLSLFVFPVVLVKWAWLRVALLFVSPLSSGFMAREMARWRQERDPYSDPNFHFWIGFCFSVGFVWVRFALANR